MGRVSLVPSHMENPLTKQENEIVYNGFKLKKNGLEAVGDPTFEQWEDCGEFIKKAEGAVQFWIGDWIRYGENHYGEMYTQAIYETGLDYQTLRDDKWVSEKIDLSLRKDNLTFNHHKEVASLPRAEQEEILKKAVDEKLTVKEVREFVKKKKKQKQIQERKQEIRHDSNLLLGDCTVEIDKLQDKSIDLLLTDPPYGMEFKSGWSDKKEIENDDLKGSLGVLDKTLQKTLPKLKDNAHAYIFGNWRYVPEVKEVISKYLNIKMMLIWDREVIGMGDLDSWGDSYDVIYFCTHKEKRYLSEPRERNVIRVQRVNPDKLQHPTEKPIEILEKLIEKSTVEGELVFDPFMGSGSTCIAAKNLNRNYVGIEMDSEYYETAQRRISGDI